MPFGLQRSPMAAKVQRPAELHGARQVGTLYRDGPVVVIPEAVLEAIIDYSESDLARERGGFLLGEVLSDQPQFVVVRHFHPALEALGNLGSLTFTHETWATLTRQINANFPNESVVGWQHTHPGMGVFLSGHDLFIQKNFFAQPWQIALVVDPRQHEFGFFHWRGGEVKDCGFVCVDDL
jgi:proteasome lid subunit RPN8/RPN11